MTKIIEMRGRNRMLRAAIARAYAAAGVETRRQVDRIAAELQASGGDEESDAVAVYENLRRRALALITGGADGSLFADHL